ncbi:MAG: cyclic nucleotide-binding domain-containing protein [Candidatus Omnitrophota bacterium]
METLEPILKEHPFFKDLEQKYFDIILGCASNVRFKAKDIIFRQRDPADKFYLIRHGKVSVDIPIARYRSITIQTIQEGDILGWSWLIPPHLCRFDCQAIEDVRAIALDGKCLREKCEKDHELGYELLKRLAKVFTQRLEYTRMQLLDCYNINVNE